MTIHSFPEPVNYRKLFGAILILEQHINQETDRLSRLRLIKTVAAMMQDEDIPTLIASCDETLDDLLHAGE